MESGEGGGRKPSLARAAEGADRLASAVEARWARVLPKRLPGGGSGGGGAGDLVRLPGSAGTTLPGPVRSDMEGRLGAHLGSVRVHTGPAAAAAADSLHAEAFTYTRDVFFGRGNYSPETPRGRALLAHELTHVVQQRAVPLAKRTPGRHGPGHAPAPGHGGTHGGALEADAEAFEAHVLGETLGRPRRVSIGAFRTEVVSGARDGRPVPVVESARLERLVSQAMRQAADRLARTPGLPDAAVDRVAIDIPLDVGDRTDHGIIDEIAARIADGLAEAVRARGGVPPVATRGGVPLIQREEKKGTDVEAEKELERLEALWAKRFDPDFKRFFWPEDDERFFEEQDVRQVTGRSGPLSVVERAILAYTNNQVADGGTRTNLKANIEELASFRPKLFTMGDADKLDNLPKSAGYEIAPIELAALDYTNNQIMGFGKDIDLRANYRRLVSEYDAKGAAQRIWDALSETTLLLPSTNEQSIYNEMRGLSYDQKKMLENAYEGLLRANGYDPEKEKGGWSSPLMGSIAGDIDPALSGWWQKIQDAWYMKHVKPDHEYFWSTALAKWWSETIKDSDAQAKLMIKHGNWAEKGLGYFNQFVFGVAHEINESVDHAVRYYQDQITESQSDVARWAWHVPLILSVVGGSMGTKALDPEQPLEKVEEGIFDLALMLVSWGAGKLVTASAKAGVLAKVAGKLGPIFAYVGRVSFKIRKFARLGKDPQKLVNQAKKLREIAKELGPEHIRYDKARRAAEKYEEAARKLKNAEEAIKKAKQAEEAARNIAKTGTNADEVARVAEQARKAGEDADKAIDTFREAERAAHACAAESGWLNNNVFARGFDAMEDALRTELHFTQKAKEVARAEKLAKKHLEAEVDAAIKLKKALKDKVPDSTLDEIAEGFVKKEGSRKSEEIARTIRLSKKGSWAEDLLKLDVNDVKQVNAYLADWIQSDYAIVAFYQKVGRWDRIRAMRGDIPEAIWKKLDGPRTRALDTAYRNVREKVLTKHGVELADADGFKYLVGTPPGHADFKGVMSDLDANMFLKDPNALGGNLAKQDEVLVDAKKMLEDELRKVCPDTGVMMDTNVYLGPNRFKSSGGKESIKAIQVAEKYEDVMSLYAIREGCGHDPALWASYRRQILEKAKEAGQEKRIIGLLDDAEKKFADFERVAHSAAERARKAGEEVFEGFEQQAVMRAQEQKLERFIQSNADDLAKPGKKGEMLRAEYNKLKGDYLASMRETYLTEASTQRFVMWKKLSDKEQQAFLANPSSIRRVRHDQARYLLHYLGSGESAAFKVQKLAKYEMRDIMALGKDAIASDQAILPLLERMKAATTPEQAWDLWKVHHYNKAQGTQIGKAAEIPADVVAKAERLAEKAADEYVVHVKSRVLEIIAVLPE